MFKVNTVCPGDQPLGLVAPQWLEMVDYCVNALTFHETVTARVNAEAQKMFDLIKAKVKILLADPVEWPEPSHCTIGLISNAIRQRCRDAGGSIDYIMQTVSIDTETFDKDRPALIDAINEKLKKFKIALFEYELFNLNQ